MHNREGDSQKDPKDLFGKSVDHGSVGIVCGRRYHAVYQVRRGIGGLIVLRRYGYGYAMILTCEGIRK